MSLGVRSVCLQRQTGPCGFLRCRSPWEVYTPVWAPCDAMTAGSKALVPGFRSSVEEKPSSAQRSHHPPPQASLTRPDLKSLLGLLFLWSFPTLINVLGLALLCLLDEQFVCVCLTKLHLNNVWHKLKKCDPPHFSPACSLEPEPGSCQKGSKILQLSLAASTCLQAGSEGGGGA